MQYLFLNYTFYYLTSYRYTCLCIWLSTLVGDIGFAARHRDPLIFYAGATQHYFCKLQGLAVMFYQEVITKEYLFHSRGKHLLVAAVKTKSERVKNVDT